MRDIKNVMRNGYKAMSSFLYKICGCDPQLPGTPKGYSDEEIRKIERLYDINITGDLNDFLLQMGRSDGGLIGDDPIILYRSAWDVRTQILVQVRFFDEMQDSGNFEHLKGKPFVFSIENETQYFYLRTASDSPQVVYHFDENNGTSSKTEYTLASYFKQLAASSNPSKALCKGELIDV